MSCDFESTVDMAKKGDFIFSDPPYTVKHNMNGFIKYNEKLFSWEDQVRLKNSLERAIIRGAKVMVTNANNESIKRLYKGFANFKTVDRASVLAANPKYRDHVQELVVRSWC